MNKMKLYEATVYQVKEDLEVAQSSMDEEMVFILESTIRALNARISQEHIGAKTEIEVQ